GDVLQQISDHFGDGRPLRTGEGHVREKGMSFQRLDDRYHAVVPPHSQIVTLCYIVSEHNPGAGADPGQHGQEYAALEGLRLIDDHECVMQAPAPDVRQREYLEHPARGDLLAHVVVYQSPERVEDRLRPGRHLLRLRAGQVAEVLAADRVQGPEHDDLLV